MSQYKYHEEKEIVPRKCCTEDRLKRLKKAGFKTLGYENGLEDILKDKGFGLPVKDGDSYTFTIDSKWVRSYFNRADALASEILLLRELKLI